MWNLSWIHSAKDAEPTELEDVGEAHTVKNFVRPHQVRALPFRYSRPIGSTRGNQSILKDPRPIKKESLDME
jgi:hypothetical protein